MGARDPRIDAYIRDAQPFARPILRHLRKVVRAACPQAGETLKWRHPHFEYKGLMCGMAAFQRHCTFGFWRGAEIGKAVDNRDRKAMGQFGRITTVADLPGPATLTRYVRAAMAINDRGVKLPMREKRRPRPPLPVPEDLARALRRAPAARRTFEGFSPSHRREYVEWIVTAKRADTRDRRLTTAIAWLTEGKPHHWKYLPRNR